MTDTCFACRVPISSGQARNGEGRCRECDANDWYETDIFPDYIKTDCHWIEDGKHVLTFQDMTERAQSELRVWLDANIPDEAYDLHRSGQKVELRNKEDFDLCYLAFV